MPDTYGLVAEIGSRAVSPQVAQGGDTTCGPCCASRKGHESPSHVQIISEKCNIVDGLFIGGKDLSPSVSAHLHHLLREDVAGALCAPPPPVFFSLLRLLYQKSERSL